MSICPPPIAHSCSSTSCVGILQLTSLTMKSPGTAEYFVKNTLKILQNSYWHICSPIALKYWQDPPFKQYSRIGQLLLLRGPPTFGLLPPSNKRPILLLDVASAKWVYCRRPKVEVGLAGKIIFLMNQSFLFTCNSENLVSGSFSFQDSKKTIQFWEDFYLIHS